MNRNVKWPVCGLIFLVLALFLIETTATRALPQRRRSTAQSKSEHVRDLFRNNCARCHGADGRGDTPLGQTYKSPDFTDPEWWRKNSSITSTARLTDIVRRGRGGMPGFGKKLTRTEIRSLVGYVRKFKP
jgi:mono/diheme cytochrome c family protein